MSEVWADVCTPARHRLPCEALHAAEHCVLDHHCAPRQPGPTLAPTQGPHAPSVPKCGRSESALPEYSAHGMPHANKLPAISEKNSIGLHPPSAHQSISPDRRRHAQRTWPCQPSALTRRNRHSLGSAPHRACTCVSARNTPRRTHGHTAVCPAPKRVPCRRERGHPCLTLWHVDRRHDPRVCPTACQHHRMRTPCHILFRNMLIVVVVAAASGPDPACLGRTTQHQHRTATQNKNHTHRPAKDHISPACPAQHMPPALTSNPL